MPPTASSHQQQRARPSSHDHHHHITRRSLAPHWHHHHHRHPRRAPPPSASVVSSPSPSSSHSSPNTNPKQPSKNIRIRLARPEDYWEASDLHCATFFEQETAHQRTRRLNQGGPSAAAPPGPAYSPLGALAARERRWMPCALRVDRCVSLQLNDDLQRRGLGRTALLLAEMDVGDDDDDDDDGAIAAAVRAGSNDANHDTTTNPLAFPRPLFFLSRLLQPPVRAGLDAALLSKPPENPAATTNTKKTTLLVGAATVDSFGDLVPPKQLDPSRDGAFGWYPRHGGDRNHYAYVSNVAVAPFVRRRGVARRLVRAAERLAAGWGLDGTGEEEEEESENDDAENNNAAAAPAWACGAAALHCSPENEAALRLYGGMGYRRVALEPAWAPYLSGRGAGGRCYLLVRRLSSSAPARLSAPGDGRSL